MGLFDFLKRGTPAGVASASVNGAEPAGSAGAGCALCGEPRAPLASPKPVACELCAVVGPVTSRCQAGHDVCDTCQASTAADVIERACAASEEREPVALALRLLRHRALQRRGPEHGFLVTAVLVAAWSNAGGEAAKRRERVAEARRRAASDARGGADGVGAFAGIAGDGALVDRMTARTRAIVGAAGAGRCCKRESILSVLAAAKLTREQLGVELPSHGVGCETSGRSKDCEGSGCPFNH